VKVATRDGNVSLVVPPGPLRNRTLQVVYRVPEVTPKNVLPMAHLYSIWVRRDTAGGVVDVGGVVMPPECYDVVGDALENLLLHT